MSTEQITTAVNAAYSYLRSALAAGGTPTDKILNVRVEEASKLMDGKFKITLSYDVIGEFAFDRKREYKDFSIDDNATTVLAMTIRTI